jgi:aminoglycoside phosphotransferase (APT) family kinase protein
MRSLKLLSDQTGKIEDSLTNLDQILLDADLPKKTIHSDYGPYNLLFRRDKLVAFLDFEIAHLDWRITDLVYAPPRFAKNRVGLNFYEIHCFIVSYNQNFQSGRMNFDLSPKFGNTSGSSVP